MSQNNDGKKLFDTLINKKLAGRWGNARFDMSIDHDFLNSLALQESKKKDIFGMSKYYRTLP